jgi:hypothetical protein
MKPGLLSNIGVTVYAVSVIAIIGYTAWRFERWANWRFSYGPAVEQRVKAIEIRLERIEHSITNK